MSITHLSGGAGAEEDELQGMESGSAKFKSPNFSLAVRCLEKPHVFRNPDEVLALNAYMRRLAYLSPLSDEALMELMASCKLRRLGPGELLLAKHSKVVFDDKARKWVTSAGDAWDGTNMYVLLDGVMFLERKTVAGETIRHEIPRGEPIGNPLTLGALPCHTSFTALCERYSAQHSEPRRMPSMADAVEGDSNSSTSIRRDEGAVGETSPTALEVLLIEINLSYTYSLVLRLDEVLMQRQKHFLSRQLVSQYFSHWTEADCEACARQLYPVYLRPRELITQEGELADTMYFIVEGRVKVSRMITKPKGGALSPLRSGSKRSRRRSTMHLRRRRSSKSSNGGKLSPSEQSTIIVDIAELRSGEVFGELGFLRHEADYDPSKQVSRWSDDYWRSALASALEANRAAIELAPNSGHSPQSSRLQEAGESPRQLSSASSMQVALMTARIATATAVRQADIQASHPPATAAASETADRLGNTETSLTVTPEATAAVLQLVNTVGAVLLPPLPLSREFPAIPDSSRLLGSGKSPGACSSLPQMVPSQHPPSPFPRFTGVRASPLPAAPTMDTQAVTTTGVEFKDIEKPWDDPVSADTRGRRQATVYADTACKLYALPYQSCEKSFSPLTTQRLREYAKGYPSLREIEQVYVRQRNWASYREKIIRDVKEEEEERRRREDWQRLKWLAS